MNNTEVVFADRKDAGQKLAKVLSHYAAEKPIVLGMPRGGVVVAYEIAQKLNATLDIVVSRKIGAPLQPEYAIGAIAERNVQIFNSEAISLLNINEVELMALVAREKKEMERRIKLYRGSKPELNLKNKVVIIVDDGVATGQTAIVSIRSVRKCEPRKIIFACGVCARDALVTLKQEADEVVCLATPIMFYAVGEWYENFAQTEDAEVIRLLGKGQ